MLEQKIILGALATSLISVQSAVAQSTAQGAASAHVIQMVNLIANVDETIDTKKVKAGDAFSAKVATASKLNDGTNVPVGSVLKGHVGSVAPSENKGNSTLTVTIDKLAIKGGKEIPVKATITHVSSFAPVTKDRPYSEPSSYQPQYIPRSRPAVSGNMRPETIRSIFAASWGSAKPRSTCGNGSTRG